VDSRRGLVALAAALITACSNSGFGLSAQSSPSPATHPTQSSSPSAYADSGVVRNIYRLSPLVVRGLTIFARFLDAYNSGTAVKALALAADDIAGNDCDYRNAEVVEFSGKTAMATWLNLRVADHDRLEISEVYNLSGDPNVVGVIWARRSSDYLSAHGFPNGVKPKGNAKIAFDSANERIRGFGNAGGSSGPSPQCVPAT